MLRSYEAISLPLMTENDMVSEQLILYISFVEWFPVRFHQCTYCARYVMKVGTCDTGMAATACTACLAYLHLFLGSIPAWLLFSYARFKNIHSIFGICGEFIPNFNHRTKWNGMCFFLRLQHVSRGIRFFEFKRIIHESAAKRKHGPCAGVWFALRGQELNTTRGHTEKYHWDIASYQMKFCDQAEE